MNSLDLEQEVDPLNVDHFSCTPLVRLKTCKSMFLKEISYAHQGCIYLIKNMRKTVKIVKYY